MTKEERLKKIHAELLDVFDNISSAMRDERMQCLQDRRFLWITGGQYEGNLAQQFENKPKIEINKLALSVNRIYSEYRNNRITVDFVPKEGEEQDKLCDTLDGLYRADEQDSVADEAYDNAFEEAVGGGFGAFRLVCEYENELDDDDERQRIRFEPITDADSCVFFDLNAKRQDKSDAKYCFVLSGMTPEEYTDTYQEEIATMQKDVQQTQFDWTTPDIIYIAEAYKVVIKRETVRYFKPLVGEEESYRDSEFEADETLLESLLVQGYKEVRTKKIKVKKVHKYIMSGDKILEDCGVIAGNNIPIVPVYGKRFFIDGVERCMGHVRLAKDSQRLKNMQMSKLAEIAALSSVEKPILSPEQIAGHQLMWGEDNIKDYPYLLINPTHDMNGNEVLQGPVAYTRSPQIPPAMAALLQITEVDMQEILGNQQAAEKMQSNISGTAIELIQNKLDMQTYIYISNFAKAIKRAGQIWLGMAREILTEPGRKMKTISKDGEVSQAQLYKPVMTENGEEYENDLSKADFDVFVDVGPSSSSKRNAIVRALTEMMQVTSDPETMQVLSGMAMINMEGEGIVDARKYFRAKLVRMGVIEPTEEEIKELQAEQANQVPDAQAEYLKAAAEEAEAKAAGARANTLLTIAKAEETKANSAKIQAEAEAQQLENDLAESGLKDILGI